MRETGKVCDLFPAPHEFVRRPAYPTPATADLDPRIVPTMPGEEVGLRTDLIPKVQV